MNAFSNRAWVLRRYPHGTPEREDFSLNELEVGDPPPGHVRVRVCLLSMDPAPRMRMDPVPRMGPPLPLGSIVIGRGAGMIEVSNDAGFAPGDLVVGELGWQERATVPATALKKVDATLAPLSAHLGILGSSGLTAYLTLHECARARPGETVVVSAAAGSVGLAACQIAKQTGCRVIALAHGSKQSAFLSNRLMVDAVIDSSNAGEMSTALSAASSQAVDVFLDSVGGALHEAVMERINVGGRAVLYGFISAYNAAAGTEPEYGRIYHLIKRRAHLMGFLLADHVASFPKAMQELAMGLRDGRLLAFEHVTNGLESVPAAFAALFGEAQPGKHLVRLDTAPYDFHSRTQ